MKYIFYTKYNRHVWRQKLIDCYKEVFSAPPWNEDWWTDNAVDEILNLYSTKTSKVLLAISADAVVGFAFSSYVSCESLSEELKLPLPYPLHTTVGYLKDIGVIDSYRQHGVAKSLLSKTVQAILPFCNNNSVLLARTLAFPEPTVVYKWFPRLGFSVVCSYPKRSKQYGQVLLGIPIHDLCS